MPQLYSHADKPLVLNEAVTKIKERLETEGDTDFATLKEKLEVLEALTHFDLGRFLILNRGIDGFWNHYIAYEFPRLAESEKPKNSTERMLIETLGDFELRVRLEMVKKLLKAELRTGISILSVPCGVMADLSTLDYSQISEIRLVGVDLDSAVIQRAKEFNQSQGLGSYAEFLCKDAWNLQMDNQFDIVVSMGLNVFVSEPDQVLALYKSLMSALKSGGKLMVSFMTPYSFRDPHTERDLSSLRPEAVRLQRIVISEIIKTRVVNFCSSQQISDQLKSVGFKKVDIQYSTCKSPNFAIGIK